VDVTYDYQQLDHSVEVFSIIHDGSELIEFLSGDTIATIEETILNEH